MTEAEKLLAELNEYLRANYPDDQWDGTTLEIFEAIDAYFVRSCSNEQ